MVNLIIQYGDYIVAERVTLALSYLHSTTFGVQGVRVTIFSSVSVFTFFFLPSLPDNSEQCGHICRLPHVQSARSSVEDLADYTNHTNKTKQAFNTSSSLGFEASLFFRLMCEQLSFQIL